MRISRVYAPPGAPDLSAFPQPISRESATALGVSLVWIRLLGAFASLGANNGAWVPVRGALDGDAICTVPESVDGCGGQQGVGKGRPPFGEIAVARHDDGTPFVAFRNQFVEVLVVGRAQRL